MTRDHIIVGLDDSPSGRAVLRWAAQHALLAGSVLRAIHVLDGHTAPLRPAWTSRWRPWMRSKVPTAPTSPTCSRRSTHVRIGRWNFLEASLDRSWCEKRRMRNYWSSELGSMSGSVDCWSVRSATIA